MKLARYSQLKEEKDLSHAARLVIGLLNAGVTDDASICGYFISPEWIGIAYNRKVERILSFISKVRQSSNPVIKEAIDNGLSVGVELPFAHFGHKLFCAGCRAHINVVPCPICTLKIPLYEPEQRPVEVRPAPKKPTSAPPGSTAKVLIMALRHSRGEHLHHKNDRKLNSESQG